MGFAWRIGWTRMCVGFALRTHDSRKREYPSSTCLGDGSELEAHVVHEFEVSNRRGLHVSHETQLATLQLLQKTITVNGVHTYDASWKDGFAQVETWFDEARETLEHHPDDDDDDVGRIRDGLEYISELDDAISQVFKEEEPHISEYLKGRLVDHESDFDYVREYFSGRKRARATHEHS